MEEEIPHTYPPSRLGEYKVIQEIAEGTFGKVKSEFVLHIVRRVLCSDLLRSRSGYSYRHWSQGCHEVHFETSYRRYQD